MPSLTSSVLLGLAFTGNALARTVVLNFDDISTPNDAGCGKDFPAVQTYDGFFTSSSFGTSGIGIYNTTATKACASANDWGNSNLNPLGRASSQPNVAYSAIGVIDFQLQDANSYLINGSSYDASVQLTSEELQASNVQITFTSLATDFGAEITTTTVFNTATDGFGPYHIETLSTNGVPYLLFEVEAWVQAGSGSIRHPALYIDNWTFDLEDGNITAVCQKVQC
ncbi:hypothetical protein V8C35DRAFT_327601 [Trichoderma chlorosporum]